LTAPEKTDIRQRRLHAAGRFFLFILVVFVAVYLTTTLEQLLGVFAVRRGYAVLIREWGGPLGTLLATWVMVRLIDHRSWQFVSMDRAAATPKRIAFGSLLGILPIAVPCAILLLAGQLKSVPEPDGSWWTVTGLTFANLLPAAAGEELFIRGYIFSIMREAIGARWTLIWTSIVFGLLHLTNPGADAQSIIIVMLAGFFLGSVLLATRSLYAAIAAHFVWNWFMAAGLHTAVSGLGVRAPDYRVIDNGPDWLTGGGWGPEGGFAAALGLFVVLIYLHARPLRRMES
jgi:membrane protease YdiL (CAAX protease family)